MRSINLPEIWLIGIVCITTCLLGEAMLPDAGCQPDWEQYDDYCYYVSDTALRYGEAEADCENKGSTLTSIHSAGENTFIENLAGGRKTWIGFNDRNEEGMFTWVDGSQVIFTNWDEDEPDGGGSRDCAIIFNGFWRDNDCAGGNQKMRIYICKAKAIPPSTTPATTTTVFIQPPTTTSLITTPTLETTSGHPMTTGSITHRSPEPQAGGSSTALIIGAVVGSLLALLIAFVLLCFMVRKRRASKSDNPHTSTQSKSLAFVGPYDLTIDSQSISTVNKQPIYANTPQSNGDNMEKHPVNANTSPSVPPTEEVYHEVIETSTDEYCVQSKQDKDKNVSIVYANVERVTPVNIPGCDVGDCEGSGDIYSVVQDKENRQDEGTEGWEENELYGTKDGNTNRDQEKADEEETEGWEENELYGDVGGHDTDTMDTEGWEENQLYGDATGSTDYRNEGWEDNIIYAGSDG